MEETVGRKEGRKNEKTGKKRKVRNWMDDHAGYTRCVAPF
jgi:hypothetical protein